MHESEEKDVKFIYNVGIYVSAIVIIICLLLTLSSFKTFYFNLKCKIYNNKNQSAKSSTTIRKSSSWKLSKIKLKTFELNLFHCICLCL